MQIAPIIERLQSEVAAFAGRVKLAVSVEFVLSDMRDFPCGYVFMPMERAADNALVNAVRQLETGEFGVLTLVKNTDDLGGLANSAELDSIKLNVRTALLGWGPADYYGPLLKVGGGLVYARDGVLIWKDSFKTEYFLRS